MMLPGTQLKAQPAPKIKKAKMNPSLLIELRIFSVPNHGAKTRSESGTPINSVPIGSESAEAKRVFSLTLRRLRIEYTTPTTIPPGIPPGNA